MFGRLVRPLIALVIVAWLALEIWLYVLAGGAIGALGVIALIIAGSVAGTAAIKHAGRRTLRSFQQVAEEAQRTGRAPTSADTPRGGGSGLTMLGGVFLIVPTLATDALGLLLVFPPTRAALRRLFGEFFASRLLARTPFGKAMAAGRAAGDQVRIHDPGGTVVPGEVVEDPPQGGTSGGEEQQGDRQQAQRPRVIEGTVVDPEQRPDP